jgi:pilus assembly protein FimV
MAAPGEGERLSEPLGASTMPQSVLPTPSHFEQPQVELEQRAALDSGSIDLDLDLDLPAGPVSAPAPLVSTQVLPREPEPDDVFSLDSVSEFPPAPAPSETGAPTSDFAMDFDLSAISLDLDSPAGAPQAAAEPPVEPEADLSGIDFEADGGDGADPLERKLELAEEFRQIGDMEGARDLLQEVVAKADGALKSKAQGMLDDLA